ncbi:hypothetical protein GCM10008957_32800 [Deinococcus ruber]|uniref:Uncharacterized protein n=2 Tax=Deinococcus ruber TaxID=1848197 RepID=A0A918F7W8_9DEIO|nr:hypothetical protein GCM10008957_32800 [Deinococcus ruber]
MDAQKSSRLTQLLCTEDHRPFDPFLHSTLARRWNLAREAYQDHQASDDDLAIRLTQIQWRNRPSLSAALLRLAEEADQLARHPANHTSPFPVLVFLNAGTYAVVRCDIDNTDLTCWRVTQPGPSHQFGPQTGEALGVPFHLHHPFVMCP